VADVFISYAHADRERVRAMAERLASQGYAPYCDEPAHKGDEAELDAARAVIAVWSETSRHSTWVCAQTSRAFDAGKLLQVRLDATAPPPPFDALPVANLSGDRPEWGPLEATLGLLVREGAVTPSKPPGLGPLPTPASAGAPKLVMIALATSLLALCGALAASRDGVMTPDQLQLTLTGAIGVGAACAALSLYRLIAIARAGS
jgi:hypothetical protein